MVCHDILSKNVVKQATHLLLDFLWWYCLDSLWISNVQGNSQQPAINGVKTPLKILTLCWVLSLFDEEWCLYFRMGCDTTCSTLFILVLASFCVLSLWAQEQSFCQVTLVTTSWKLSIGVFVPGSSSAGGGGGLLSGTSPYSIFPRFTNKLYRYNFLGVSSLMYFLLVLLRVTYVRMNWKTGHNSININEQV